MIRKVTSFFISTLCAVVIFGSFLFYLLIPEPTLAKRFDFHGLLVKYKQSNDYEYVKIGLNQSINETLDQFRNNPQVEAVELNYIYQAAIVPNDYYYDNQWYLGKIKAPQSWDIVSSSPDIIIAIVDSGIQINHPDLEANIWQNIDEIPNNEIDDDKNGFIDDFNGWDFINNKPDPSPKFEASFTESGVLHGTIVAGIAAAIGDNKYGVSGVTWQAKIMPLRVLDDQGSGMASEVIRAIDYATANGADIINLSFVGFGYSQGLQDAIERAYRAGIVVVAAAGNEQEEGEGYNLDQTPMYPICYKGSQGEDIVVGVAATDTLDQKTGFSSFGSKCVDIAAPGVSIFTTSLFEPLKRIDGRTFNTYYDGYWSGTSMAAPMVSGAIALLETINPYLNRDQIVSSLLTGSDNINRLNPVYINKLGAGRLNIERSVNNAISLLEVSNNKILVAPLTRHEARVKIISYKGVKELEFLAFTENFRGGADVTAGDINGNGQEEIIVSAGFSGGPQIRIFDKEGIVRGQFFAYDKNFRGGISVATGDVNNDGKDEIVVGIGKDGEPKVRIFDSRGQILGQFFAYNNNFRGGVQVAVGDVDGDGQDEIVTGAGNGGGPQVRIFDGSGNVQGQFFAYDKDFRGGVRVATGNINKGARNYAQEIITSPGPGGGPHIRIFNNQAKLKGEFFAFGDQYRGGVQISAGDFNNDGIDEIIAGTGPVDSPYVRIFKINGTFIGSFYAYDPDLETGVNLAVINY